MNNSIVYLIGAGPGDCGLISNSGLEILKTAQVLIYDNLANPLLLQNIRDDCEKIFVGKIPGNHSVKQNEINEILIKKAKENKIVVRLKGGDPFVFGRGGEEILALEKENIPYIVVPGITSAIAALEACGIPVTHRNEARSFHVITGHTADECENERFLEYAKLSGTLVFLMGVSHLGDIANQLLKGGKDKNTPVSIVESATTVRQRRIDATLCTIADIAEKEGVKNPAVIVVGEVAKYKMNCSYLPFAEKKIAVTGSKNFVCKVSKKLKDCGAFIYEVPYIKTQRKIENFEKIPSFDKIGWLIFTSSNGVDYFFDWLLEKKIDLRALANIKFCVVGSGTANSLLKRGFIADFVPEMFTVENMSKCLVEKIRADKNFGEKSVVALRAFSGSKIMNEIFDKNGLNYLDIDIYDTKTDDFIIEQFLKNIDVLDYITFASSSGVCAFFEKYNKQENRLKDSCIFVCIGTKTYETLKHYDENHFVKIANRFDADGIVEAIYEK